MYNERKKQTDLAYQKAHPDLNRNRQFRKKYGITLKDYKVMVENQNNLCKICNQLEPGKKLLGVDHCHKTKKIRGLLCSKCNIGLGFFKDNVENLKRAVEYLTTN